MTITINGGTITNLYGGSRHNNGVLTGDITVYWYDGTIKNLDIDGLGTINGTSKLVKPEAKDVHAAIKLFESTGQKTFFTNVQMVTDTIAQLNRSNIKDIETFIDELTEQAVSLESLNKILIEENDAYYKSIGQD